MSEKDTIAMHGENRQVFIVHVLPPRTILIELFDDMKRQRKEEPAFVDRCIAETVAVVEKAMRDYVT